jgi:hypothetical protein
VARLIERAIAGEVAPVKLSPDVLNRDSQATAEQILAVPPHRLWSPERQRVWVSPLGRPRHDDDVRRKPRALAA